MKKCMVLLMLLGLCGNAFAYNNWLGGVSTRWDVGGNWSGGVPAASIGANSTCLVGDFSINPTILIDAATAFRAAGRETRRARKHIFAVARPVRPRTR